MGLLMNFELIMYACGEGGRYAKSRAATVSSGWRVTSSMGASMSPQFSEAHLVPDITLYQVVLATKASWYRFTLTLDPYNGPPSI
jgi:hypothetical protein